MSADPIAALHTVLLADPTVAGLVVDRVYGLELHPDVTDSMPRAAIVLSPAGGGLLGRGSQQFGDIRVDVTCYGETLYESWLVYLAAYDVLKAIERRKVNGVLLHWARPSSRGDNARDPEKQWPTCYSSWQVLAAEIAAP